MVLLRYLLYCTVHCDDSEAVEPSAADEVISCSLSLSLSLSSTSSLTPPFPNPLLNPYQYLNFHRSSN